MKHVKTDVLVPGMVVAMDYIGDNRQLIVPKGLVLTDKSIRRLEMYGIKTLHIEDPVGIDVEEVPEELELDTPNEELPEPAEDLLLGNTRDALLSALEGLEGFDAAQDAEPLEDLSGLTVEQQEEPSHFEKVQASPEFKVFKESFENNVSELKGHVNDIVEKNSPIDVDVMLSSTMSLLSDQTNSFGVFDMLHNMRQYDDMTYAHCMNVALICNVFAGWIGFTKEEAKLATACGMLHDVGKLKIDDAIIKKPGRLTESEFKQIKRHPIEGYKILQHQDISEHIKNAALMHHEKCDGSGYPFGLSGDKIDTFAKLVSIADVYDAMTSERVYRGALCPFTVIELFEKEGLEKYDILYVMTFLENVINTYIDNRVMLSNGKVGIIRWIDKQKLSRPMIQLADQSFLELSKHPELRIIKIL